MIKLIFPAHLGGTENVKQFENMLRRIKGGIKNRTLLVMHTQPAELLGHEIHILAPNSGWWLDIIESNHNEFRLKGGGRVGRKRISIKTRDKDINSSNFYCNRKLSKLWESLLEYAKQQKKAARDLKALFILMEATEKL